MFTDCAFLGWSLAPQDGTFAETSERRLGEFPLNKVYCRQSEVPRCLGDSSSAATYLDVSFSEDLLQTI